MKFAYIGNPSDPEDSYASVKAFGIVFKLNVPIVVSDAKVRAKLSGNPQFKLCDDDKPQATRGKRIKE